jgi:hypothetical protein
LRIFGSIPAELPPSWTDFVIFLTFLNHMKQELDITDLIGFLDIEEKARAKD